MFLILTFIHIIRFRQALTINGFDISPGVPVPHADELDRILGSRIFENSSRFDTNSVFEYLFGESFNFNESDRSEAAEHLDISILDPETIKRIVQVARRKHDIADKLYNPVNAEKGIGRFGYYHNQEYIVKTFDFMRQSIYGTRRRLKDTRPIRKKYHQDISYNIGILYGTLMQLRYKLDNVYSTVKMMYFHNKFLWFLILYQKCLALSVDITYVVQRMFDFHSKFSEKFVVKEERDYNYVPPGQVGPKDRPGGPGPGGPGPGSPGPAGPGPGGPGSSSLRLGGLGLSELSPVSGRSRSGTKTGPVPGDTGPFPYPGGPGSFPGSVSGPGRSGPALTRNFVPMPHKPSIGPVPSLA